MAVMAPLPLLFPLVNILLVPELRTSVLQLCLMRNWTAAQRDKLEQEKQEKEERKAGRRGKEEDGQLSELQLQSLRQMGSNR